MLTITIIIVTHLHLLLSNQRSRLSDTQIANSPHPPRPPHTFGAVLEHWEALMLVIPSPLRHCHNRNALLEAHHTFSSRPWGKRASAANRMWLDLLGISSETHMSLFHWQHATIPYIPGYSSLRDVPASLAWMPHL